MTDSEKVDAKPDKAGAETEKVAVEAGTIDSGPAKGRAEAGKETAETENGSKTEKVAVKSGKVGVAGDLRKVDFNYRSDGNLRSQQSKLLMREITASQTRHAMGLPIVL